MWTFTTDPSVLDAQEALRTLARRWHVLHRSMIRIKPHLRYVKVLEFTKSGLPHLHVITPEYIDWHKLHPHVKRLLFGKILNVIHIPPGKASWYVAKYAAKALYSNGATIPDAVRMWSATVGFLVSWGSIAPRSDLVFVAITRVTRHVIEAYYRNGTIDAHSNRDGP
jgi:hypothetical protein